MFLGDVGDTDIHIKQHDHDWDESVFIHNLTWQGHDA